MANEKAIWDRLYASIQNPYGVAGVMGNFQAESAMRANNLSAGYGLYQATFWSIKQHLLNYARTTGKSVGDWAMQVDQFVDLLKSEYDGVWQTLLTATSVRQASDAVLLKFERPADQSERAQVYRASQGQRFFDEFVREPELPNTTLVGETMTVSVDLPVLLMQMIQILFPYHYTGGSGRLQPERRFLVIHVRILNTYAHSQDDKVLELSEKMAEILI